MRNIVIAVLLTLILFLVFPGKKENDKAGIIPEGFIYEVNSSSRAASSNIGIYEAGEEIKEETEMKKYKAFFDLELPDEFRVVKSRDRSSSDFLIVSAAVAAEAEKLAEKAAALAKQQEIRQKQAQLQAQQQAAQKKQSENKESKSQTEESTAPQSAKKETKHDYNTYNNIIKNSRKTFFFPDNFKNISDVAAGVISITPYEDKHIVKFQIQNKSSGYFFVANTALYKGSDFVICDYYNDSMVAGGRVLEGIIVAPQFKSRQKITFKLLESAGKNRVYEISINIP